MYIKLPLNISETNMFHKNIINEVILYDAVKVECASYWLRFKFYLSRF